MRKFIASLLLVGVLGFVGCGEKTNEEKANDAIEEGKEKAGEALDSAKEAIGK
ncbi:MAG: hypothetical protein NE327_12845 [Lentisphaeraceae bacterium]|nr:hypothetical protein [Lentisphaeraceae bacterium]